MLAKTLEMKEKTDRMWEILSTADAVILGAGAGLSVSAGYTYEGERFRKYFADFEARYHFHDMYSGGFYPYKTREELWAYWSRYIWINRYLAPPKPVYEKLFTILKDKDYFVLTTNVDHCFQKAAFDKHRLFYTQGDFGLFQCSQPCHQATYDNEDMVRKMVSQQKDGRIPSCLIPYCPVCGRPMSMNLRCDDTFVQDEGWYLAAKRYDDFCKRHRHSRAVYLELGVGMNTPGIIKYHFWQNVDRNPDAFYLCINKGQAHAPGEIASRSLCLDSDIGEVLELVGQSVFFCNSSFTPPADHP